MAGEAEGVRVLGRWSNPFALRPQIALKLKKVEYEFVEETMNHTPSELQLMSSNPVYNNIPVLIHNGKAICHSLLIIQYVDEAWSSGQQILPADPFGRAAVRFWASVIDGKWSQSLLGIAKAQTDQERASFLERMLTVLTSLEKLFAARSKGKPFFGEDSVGYLDIVLGCSLGLMRAVEQMFGFQILDGAKTPLLAAWAERFCAHDAVKEVMPKTEKLVEFVKEEQARRNAASAPAN